MHDDQGPTGVRRTLLVWCAFVRIGIWIAKAARSRRSAASWSLLGAAKGKGPVNLRVKTREWQL